MFSAKSVSKDAYVRSTRAGTWVPQLEGYEAFLPRPLPPVQPLAFDATLTALLSRADRAVGKLAGIAALVPNPDLFVYLYVRKEALLSSQIEGTRCSLEDVFELSDETARSANADVEEVSNYIRAMNEGLRGLRLLPVSSRLIRDIHTVLMQGVRGASKRPGEFRRDQNWIGMYGASPQTADFVPPPPSEVENCMAELERFIHTEEALPELIRAALAHAQFETIHPFLDGNGRLGRLLITFLLCSWNVLEKPLLYLSYFFKANRTEYYTRLNNVRMKGEWEAWVMFFLRGVEETAETAAQIAREIYYLHMSDREKLGVGSSSKSALLVFDQFCRFPIASIGDVKSELDMSFPRAQRAIETLVEAGIVREESGKKRGRVFAYRAYLDVLRRDTVLPMG
jgi:Fic family protein